jgi:hypothetical protein
MTDCCRDKANARNAGMFEGPVGDDWYLCECKKKEFLSAERTLNMKDYFKNTAYITIETLFVVGLLALINYLFGQFNGVAIGMSAGFVAIYDTIANRRRIEALENKVN